MKIVGVSIMSTAFVGWIVESLSEQFSAHVFTTDMKLQFIWILLTGIALLTVSLLNQE